MTAIQAIAVVMIRFWAVGWIIAYLSILSQSIGMHSSYPDEQGARWFVISGQIAYLFIVAFWLVVLCYSRRLTLWVLPPVKEADHKFHIEPPDIIRVGTFLIGVYFLTQYVPDLLKSIPQLVAIYSQDTVPGGFGQQVLIEIALRVVPILIALWLVFRPNHLVRLFTWLRRAGLPKEGAAEEGAGKMK